MAPFNPPAWAELRGVANTTEAVDSQRARQAPFFEQSMFRVLAQAFRGLLVASAFFFFWAGAVLLAWTLCPVLAVTIRDDGRRWAVCRRVVRVAFGWFHGYMRALTLLDAHLVGPAVLGPGRVVAVANHPTLVDVTAILAQVDDLCCVVKPSLIRSFFVGRLIRTCGHIDGGDGGAMSGAAVMQEAQRRLEAGVSVLIFPEGTRSPAGGMHGFRRGAFEIAARARVPVRPLFLTCTPPALSKGVPFWRQPSRMAELRIQLSPLVEVSDARAACLAVEAAYRQRLGLAAPEAAGAASRRFSGAPRRRRALAPGAEAREDSPGSP
jgi:1-acyl-sn-glycerol-3-phosphate acyltransferase